jgi:CubicO group peptidase (beta-lactamase class C family)
MVTGHQYRDNSINPTLALYAIMLLYSTLLWAALASAKCYEPDVAHPLPDYDARDHALQQAFARIKSALIDAVAAPEFAATSFSVEITSSKESLWSQHHTARERNSSRPDIPEVNGDALYRIASITKTFTVLAILQQQKAGKLNLDDSIDTYVEDLKGKQEGSIPWKDITLRSLASQLSGIPRDCKIFLDHSHFRGCQSYKGTHTDPLCSRTGRSYQHGEAGSRRSWPSPHFSSRPTAMR